MPRRHCLRRTEADGDVCACTFDPVVVAVVGIAPDCDVLQSLWRDGGLQR